MFRIEITRVSRVEGKKGEIKAIGIPRGPRRVMAS